jgi:hypothetical protein
VLREPTSSRDVPAPGAFARRRQAGRRWRRFPAESGERRLPLGADLVPPAPGVAPGGGTGATAEKEGGEAVSGIRTPGSPPVVTHAHIHACGAWSPGRARPARGRGDEGAVRMGGGAPLRRASRQHGVERPTQRGRSAPGPTVPGDDRSPLKSWFLAVGGVREPLDRGSILIVFLRLRPGPCAPWWAVRALRRRRPAASTRVARLHLLHLGGARAPGGANA